MPPKILERQNPYPAADLYLTAAQVRAPAADLYLTAVQVRARYGGVTSMSLWRWLHDPELHFPVPLLIKRRRYWRLNDLLEFERRIVAGKGAAVA
jgi:hypothetical protein